MVRLKSNPFKSLPSINFEDPEIRFWFFGQKPTQKKKNDLFVRKNSPKESDTGTKFVHPLANLPDIPQLTDLQVYITEAIMIHSKNGHKSVDLEKIYEYVSKRWRNVRRRDGTTYNTDCRRAIQANLRHNPHHIPLFKKDAEKQNHWSLCYTLEEAQEASKEKLEKKKIRSERTPRDLRYLKSEDASQGNDRSPSNAEEGGETVPKEQQNPDDASETTSDLEVDEQMSLEQMICDGIQDHSGSCHLDYIYLHVSKNRQKLLNFNQSPDFKESALKETILKTLLNSVSDGKKIFKRDTKKTGWWMINNGVNLQELQFNRITSEVNSQKEELEEEKIVDDDVENEEETSQSKKASSRDPQMTELQILIIETIDKYDGTATFEQILEQVSKNFENLRTRNGTPYTSDCKKAVQASLSNNPASRPFFKVKKDRKGNTTYSLAKRSSEFLEERRAQGLSINTNGAHKTELLNTEETVEEEEEVVQEVQIKEDPTSMNENGKEEEEIVDEEEEIKDEEEEEQEKESQAKNTPKEKTREDKHFLPNRMRRARQLKEKAGKRKLNREIAEASKEIRSKRRKQRPS